MWVDRAENVEKVHGGRPPEEFFIAKAMEEGRPSAKKTDQAGYGSLCTDLSKRLKILSVWDEAGRVEVLTSPSLTDYAKGLAKYPGLISKEELDLSKPNANVRKRDSEMAKGMTPAKQKILEDNAKRYSSDRHLNRDQLMKIQKNLDLEEAVGEDDLLLLGGIADLTSGDTRTEKGEKITKFQKKRDFVTVQESFRAKKQRAKAVLLHDVRAAHNAAHNRMFCTKVLFEELYHADTYTSDCVNEILHHLIKERQQDVPEPEDNLLSQMKTKKIT
jgi:hypothetical protein